MNNNCLVLIFYPFRNYSTLIPFFFSWFHLFLCSHHVNMPYLLDIIPLHLDHCNYPGSLIRGKTVVRGGKITHKYKTSKGMSIRVWLDLRDEKDMFVIMQMNNFYPCVKSFDANIALFAQWQPDMCVVILTSLWLVEQLNLTKRGRSVIERRIIPQQQNHYICLEN